MTCVVLLHAGAATVFAFATVVDKGGDSEFLKGVAGKLDSESFFLFCSYS